jgi:hypothetical protein
MVLGQEAKIQFLKHHDPEHHHELGHEHDPRIELAVYPIGTQYKGTRREVIMSMDDIGLAYPAHHSFVGEGPPLPGDSEYTWKSLAGASATHCSSRHLGASIHRPWRARRPRANVLLVRGYHHGRNTTRRTLKLHFDSKTNSSKVCGTRKTSSANCMS